MRPHLRHGGRAPSAFIVEVMGRRCGYLAMRAGIAAEAGAILFAERKIEEDDFVERLVSLIEQSFDRDRKKRRVLIVKAEGVEVFTWRLKERLDQALSRGKSGAEVRETILGHVVRGGRPSASDRVLAQRLAFCAVLALERGEHDVMLGWEVPGGFGERTDDPAVRRIGLSDVLDETERLLDGQSPVVRRRVELLERVEGILAL